MELAQYQTLMVGVIGFTGVIFTIYKNGSLARSARLESIAHERETVRIALTEELRVLQNACTFNLEVFADIPPDQPNPVGLPSYEAMSTIYNTFLGKLGLLSPQEVRAIMNAYLRYQQTIYICSTRFAGPGGIGIAARHLPRVGELLGQVHQACTEAIRLLDSKSTSLN
jgi:hypothetical protein